MSSFCTEILLQKKSQSQTVIKEKLQKAFLYEKGVHKMLMKLTPGDDQSNDSRSETLKTGTTSSI